MDKKLKKEVNNHKEPIENQEVVELKKQIEEFKNKYLRALADYHNLEKRVLEEKSRVKENASGDLFLKLLPFLDNLEKAEIFVKDEGLKLARKQLETVLAEYGVEEIAVLNQEYDPYTAEVIEIVKGEKDNVVNEVIRKGYRMNDRILRVAQVKVSRKI